jgi:hypothetical protein
VKPILGALLLLCGTCAAGRAAQCTTVLDPRLLEDYAIYIRAAESVSAGRFDAGELGWLAESERNEARGNLAAGKIVQKNLSTAAGNQHLAARNGTIIHWVGAIRIRNRNLQDLAAVLRDYDGWERFYHPVVYASRGGPEGALSLGLHSVFRFASILPQHYSFRVQARTEGPGTVATPGTPLRLHLMATEVRESDSGVPGRNDLLEAGRDHGIMWALDAYWRARAEGRDIYFEFESITLARSVQAFSCKIGFVPVPKSAVSSAMNSIPAQSVKVILEGTRAECERRQVPWTEWPAGAGSSR